MDVSRGAPIQNGGSISSDAVAYQGKYAVPSDGTVQFQDGQLVKGQIENISTETLTARLAGGQVITFQINDMPDARIGDSVLFRIIYTAEGVGAEILPPDMTEIKYNMLKSALETAGLKIDDLNLKLVSALIDNHLPLNKQSILTLNRGVKIVGVDQIEKPLFLMNNGLTINTANLESLNQLMDGSARLLTQAEQLTAAILSLPPETLPEQLLNIILRPEAEHSGQQKQADPINTEANDDQKRTAQELPEAKAILAQAKPISALLQDMVLLANAEAKPLNDELQELIDKNKDAILKSLLPQIQNGTLTAADLTTVLERLPEGEKGTAQAGLPQNAASALQAIINGMSEKEAEVLIAQTKRTLDANLTLAKKISGAFAFRLKDKANSIQELKDYFQSVSTKLLAIQEAIREKPDGAQVEKELASAKSTLLFLDDLKGSYLQLPFVLHQDPHNSEIYVFADKQSKKRLSMSGSALIALDTANLGHFETYIQKEEKQIHCQFRLENEDVQHAVEGALDQLKDMLSDHGYQLTAYSFKIGEEPFAIGQEEPVLDNDSEVSPFRYNIDIRT